MRPSSTSSDAADRAAALLRWGDRSRRDLPWRHTRDPWAVLVAEVMLQQTQVERVRPRWPGWVQRWPTPAAQAAASPAEVLRAWQGLGYPRRARDLWRAAGSIVEHHAGSVPEEEPDLRTLPGVGPYTARAVRVFAFEADEGVLDTNVGRVLARWQCRRLAVATARQLADDLVPAGAGWVWNQTLLDLAATVCTKRAPSCGVCPVRGWCGWSVAGRPDPDPAEGSAGVSRRQARFDGSHRQRRGEMLRALADAPLPADAHLDRSARAALASLADDDLVDFDGSAWHLRT